MRKYNTYFGKEACYNIEHEGDKVSPSNGTTLNYTHDVKHSSKTGDYDRASKNDSPEYPHGK